MKMITRLRWHGRALVTMVALVMIAMTVLPAAAAPVQQSNAELKTGAVATLAVDDVGGGWGFAGPANSGDSSGHIIRLQDGSWHDVPKSDPSVGALKNAVSIYKIVLSGDGKSGWAIGSGGGQNIWHWANGTWQLSAFPFEKGVVLLDLTADASATDGWITGQDQSARYVVARLQNGKWAHDLQPVNGDMRYISLAPGGKEGWAIGSSRNDPSKHIAVRLENGKWVYDDQHSYDIPFNSIAVTADDNGNGWVIGPAINSVLVRLTPRGAIQVLPDPRQEKPSLYAGIVFQAIAVNGVGRGWATATYKPTSLPLGHQPVNQPLLFRLDGDNFTAITPTEATSSPLPTNPQSEDPNYGGPVAFSPDGTHSWLAEATGKEALIGITALREPWAHDNPPAADPLPGAGVCFNEVEYCLRGVFATYWHERGGLYNMGYPITPEIKESINGTSYTVQYTQRARMEYHPEFQGTPYVVELGLLGDVLSDPRSNEAPFRPAPAHTDPTGATEWFSQTQHNLGPPFLAYWNQNGGLPIFGYPRSESFNEVNQADSNTYLVQYFERNRIEYHPENKGTQFEFLLGLLGVEQFKATYGYVP